MPSHPVLYPLALWVGLLAPATVQAAPGIMHPSNTRPSGLPFDSGVFSMHQAAQASAFAARRGAALDVLTVFPTRDSWEAVLNPWWLDGERIPAGFRGTLSVGLGLWPQNGSLAAAARGDDQRHWEALGRLIARRFPTAYVRIGPEMNLKNDWAATPANAAQWKKAFRYAARALRRGGPGLRVVWNPNEGPGQTGTQDAALFYPGDDVVDVIGIDAYDWWPAYTTPANWLAHRDGPYGWNHWLGFARAHGKKFALPEWGVYTGSSASGGDNALYIRHVYGWLSQNRAHIAFEAYFNDAGAYCQCSLLTAGQNPRASAEYKGWIARLGRRP